MSTLVPVKPSENLVVVFDKHEKLLKQLADESKVYNDLWIAIFQKLMLVRKNYFCFRRVQIEFLKQESPDQLPQEMKGDESLSSYAFFKLKDLGARCPHSSVDSEIDDVWSINPYIEQIAVICCK